MKKLLFAFGIFFSLIPIIGAAQTANLNDITFTTALTPLEVGFRYDDNVFRAIDIGGRQPDEIYLLDGGAHFASSWDVFKGDLDYHLGADQYQFYSVLNNIKNNLNLLLAVEPGDLRFYYRKEYFIRDSQYDQFNYWDDDNLLGFQWTPEGPWNFEMKVKYFSRQYYNQDPTIQTQNFIDQGVLAGIQREINGQFFVKLEGSYNNRQFNRWAVNETASIPGTLQMDETWSVLLNAHVYFENILQDFNLEEQRTNSNSYGFSNTVQSASWAAVVRPSPSIYLELLFRLFSKSYDVQPLVNPELHIGFVDEDSQDLLSIKTSWEWAPQWAASLDLSRARNEYIQPGQFYIEDLLTATIKRKF